MSDKITKSPQYRFARFTDAWERRKLGEVLIKNSQKNKDLAIENVESVSNKTGFTKQTEQFDNYSVASEDLSNYYVIREKQFAYNPSRINVGSIAYKAEGEEKSVVSPLYVSFSTTHRLEDSYLWNWVKTSGFERQRQTLSEGGVRDTLSFNQLAEMYLLAPNIEEQQKIGAFFKDLDDTISLHQRELELLKDTKKGLLKKMFPKDGANVPEIRFKGFTDTWEQLKLRNVANYIRGSFPQPYTNPDFYDEENGKPFVQVADIGFDLKLNPDTKAHISKIAEPKSRFVEAGKVVVALQGSIEKSIGRTAITQYDAYFDRTILIFEDYKVPMDKLYFAQVIKELFEREKERAWGATISTITKEHLNDFVIGVPKIEEQKLIGNLFTNIDETITLHQRKLNSLKCLKKSLLQKMFV